uniref:Uncharacterized protein n=1 Tax=Sphaerodactylus townsendi TaxID=933632 RepID=A0ACB8FDR8_9SAUR
MLTDTSLCRHTEKSRLELREMLENVKKCKNFLATLIKLASSGPQAPKMGQNVKNLVQSLLEGKIEPEEFTKKLYIELKSSPQPYLVPFLKKSMLALRQLMPNTQSFIQQCLQQSSTQSAAPVCAPMVVTTPSLVACGPPLNTAARPSARPAPRTPVGTLSPQISNSVSCTPLATRGSHYFQFVHPVQTSSGVLQVSNPVPPSPLTTGIVTKTVHLPHSTAVTGTGTTSLQGIKPAVASTASSSTLSALNAAKSVSSAAVTTSLQVVKQTLTTATVTSTPTVTSSLQSVIPITGTPITIRLAHPNSVHPQSAQNSQAIRVKQLTVQQPPGSTVRKVTSMQQTSELPVAHKSSEKNPINELIQANQLSAGSIVKQITLPGNKILSLQASPVQRNKIKGNGTTSFRDEDDINDVTFMAGVNLSEESACILATNSDAVGTLIRSCPEEQLLSSDVLQMRILETALENVLFRDTSFASEISSFFGIEDKLSASKAMAEISDHAENLLEKSAADITPNAGASDTKLLGTVPSLSPFNGEMALRSPSKRHDITEVNSEVLGLISHATQEWLRGLLEKLTIIAQHRIMTCKDNNMYAMSSDARTQLRFLEKLDHMEKQRKDEEEREMLLRAAKVREFGKVCHSQDPEQLNTL